MRPQIEVWRLGKRFRLEHRREPYLTLAGRLTSVFSKRRPLEDFWALQDIDMQVMAGTVVGIVGRNGAGKSTLLKILSRVTPPTTGKAILDGRVASLLEVGTGFHPELTGRENIFVNGSILGMKRQEIRENFDAIVDFAGTERFLDTPLKYYSSGMQLRLAFAVAAFLHPEILIIDEVLAVGDAEFQRKCIGKMQEVAGSGRTILFVSHNLAALERLCTEGVLLEAGRLVSRGPIQKVVAEYTRRLEEPIGKTRKENLKYVRDIYLTCNEQADSPPYMGCDLGVHLRFESPLHLEYPVLGIFINDETRTPLLAVNNKHYVGNLVHGPVQSGLISVVFEKLPLFAGQYSIDVFFGNGHEDLEIVQDALRFSVDALHLTQSGSMPEPRYNRVYVEKTRWSYTP